MRSARTNRRQRERGEDEGMSEDVFEVQVIRRIIEDTSVPKTFRRMFENYLKWKEEER